MWRSFLQRLGRVSRQRVSTDSNERLRTIYLESVLRQHSNVTLPIGPTEGLSLAAVFQPLKLRHEPLEVEDLVREDDDPDRTSQDSFDDLHNDQLERPIDEDDDASLSSLENKTSGDDENAFDILEADEKWMPDLPDRIVIDIIADNGSDALLRSTQKRMVVLGGPGTGKTTVLKYLISEQARKALTNSATSIPIFISLPDLARSEKTLRQYLSDIVSEMEIDEGYAEVLAKALQDGQAFLCLDSLDEVAPDQRAKMIEWINTWASDPGNTWIVGSRFTEYKGGQFGRDRFTEWELQPMSHQLRQELAGRLLPELYRLSQRTQITSGQTTQLSSVFVDALEAHPQTATWGENPLLFSLAAVVFVRTGFLPSSRAALYREVIDAVLETREQDSERRTILRYALADVALKLYQKKDSTFTKDILLGFLANTQQRFSIEVTELANCIIASGVLEVVAREKYGFQHQTFQEYLAAVEMARRLVNPDQTVRSTAWNTAWSKRTYSRWIEVLRLLIGVLVQEHGKEGSREALRWLHALVEEQTAPGDDPGNLEMALALKSLSEVIETKDNDWEEAGGPSLTREIIRKWASTLLSAVQSGREAQNERLLALASEIGNMGTLAVNEAVEQLKELLSNPDDRVRRIAVRTMGKLGEHAPIELLSNAALYESNTYVRMTAVQELGKLDEHIYASESLVDTLRAALQHNNPSVRISAVQILGKIAQQIPIEKQFAGTLSLVEVFGEMGLHDAEADVRVAVLQVLGELSEQIPAEDPRDASLVATLIEALSDSRPTVRIAAVYALGRLVETSVRDYLPIVGPLVAALRDKSQYVRAAAVRVLGKLEERSPLEPIILASDKPVDMLIKALDDKDNSVRVAALEALGKLAAPIPLEPVISALNDKDERVRIAAVKSLGKLGEQTPVELLFEIVLHSEHDDERKAAAQALEEAATEAGKRVPVESLLPAVRAGRPAIREAAVRLLGRAGERAPTGPLIEVALYDKDERVRIAAAEALGKLGERVPGDPLVRALRDIDPYVRVAAAKALGVQGKRAPIEPLKLALRDKIPQVRSAVVGAMGKLGEQIPVELLLQALQDYNSYVRTAAAEALETRLEQVPLDAWINALQDSSDYVRLAAARAIGKYSKQVAAEASSEPRVVSLLLTALKDVKPQLRAAAARALEKQSKWVPGKRLLEVALYDIDADVRRAAAQVVATMGEQAPIEELTAALSDSESYVRAAAAYVFEQLGERELVSAPLVDALASKLNDDNSYVRSAIARALGAMGRQVDIDVFTTSLRDSNPYVRAATTQALGKLVGKFLEETMPLEAIFPIMEALIKVALDDVDEYVRTTAVQALEASATCVPLVDALPVEPFIEALRSDKAYVRAASIRAMVVLGEHTPIERLATMLQDNIPYVRAVTAQTLGRLAEQGALPLTIVAKGYPLDLLLVALGDREVAVRLAVIQVLARLGDRTPVKAIITALSDKEGSVRAAAAKALRTLKVGEAIPGALPVELLTSMALYDSDPKVRRAVAQTLAALAVELPLTGIFPVTTCMEALQSNNPQVRSAATQTLLMLGERVPVEPLIDTLQDKDPLIRAEAMKALEERVPKDELLSTLANSYTPVREMAIQVLQALGKRAPLEPLFAALGDKSPSVREIAVRALAALEEYPLTTRLVGSQSLLDVLVEVTLRDTNKNVRTLAIQALEKLGKQDAIDVLIRALQQPNKDVRAGAVSALRKLGVQTFTEPQTVYIYDMEEDGQVLLPPRRPADQMQGEDTGKRELRGYSYGKRARADRGGGVRPSGKWQVRLAEVEELGKRGKQAPIEPLLFALRDSNWQIRRAAVRALGELGEQAPVEALMQALHDREREVRLVAAKAVGGLGKRAPIERLFTLMHDKNQHRRAAAARSIGAMGNEAPLERLRESLYDSDWCLRDAAVRALGMLEESLSPGEPVVSALIDRLVYDENETVRLTALRALRKRAPLEVFVSALRDRDGEVRAAAAKILGELGEQAPVESLIEALHDSNWQVRDAAAKALGSLGKRIAVGPLQEALRDSHWAVRAAAAHSLGGQGILEPLLPVLGDSEKTVREMTLNRLRSHPEILSLVAPEAQVILLGQGMGTVLGSLTQSFIAEALGNMTHPSPVLLEKLTQLLDWPYWEVRMKAIQALKKMPRNIPDAAIRRLLELRHDPESQAVRNAADDALAEILSLETGIEDD